MCVDEIRKIIEYLDTRGGRGGGGGTYEIVRGGKERVSVQNYEGKTKQKI